MKRITITILFTLLWLAFVNVIQLQPRSYALSFSTSEVNTASTAARFDTMLRHQTVLTDLAVPQIRVWPLDGSLVSLDGQAVRQIDLQPQDAIILQNADRCFLPLLVRAAH